MENLCLKEERLDPGVVIQGDMYGDRILISESHEVRASRIFELISPLVTNKFVVAVGGPSGSGKSEIAALVGTKFITEMDINAYIISCDNYAHRPPRENDAERAALHQNNNGKGLEAYLGTQNEADFNRLNSLIVDFKKNIDNLDLRIMDAKESKVHKDPYSVDVSKTQVIVLEGTWSHLVAGADMRVFLETDFEKTLAHRKSRARDPITPFGEKVLKIEQMKLDRIKESANIVIRPDGNFNIN